MKQYEIIRTISSSVFNKIVSKPFHFLYGRVIHIYSNGKDVYGITRDFKLVTKELTTEQTNDLWERSY